MDPNADRHGHEVDGVITDGENTSVGGGEFYILTAAVAIPDMHTSVNTTTTPRDSAVLTPRPFLESTGYAEQIRTFLSVASSISKLSRQSQSKVRVTTPVRYSIAELSAIRLHDATS